MCITIIDNDMHVSIIFNANIHGCDGFFPVSHMLE